MKKFVKKPVVIEAMQFLGGWSGDGSLLCDWIGEDASWSSAAHAATEGYPDAGGVLHIHTLEGTMTAMAGDWIIKGVRGEFYPCKPDIFEQTYSEDV